MNASEMGLLDDCIEDSGVMIMISNILMYEEWLGLVTVTVVVMIKYGTISHTLTQAIYDYLSSNDVIVVKGVVSRRVRAKFRCLIVQKICL